MAALNVHWRVVGEHVDIYSAPHVATWNTLSPEQRSQSCCFLVSGVLYVFPQKQFCRFCGKTYKTRETRKQHDDDVHIGKRCHFQLHDGICGDVFDTEEAIIMHLDNHLLTPTTDENGKRWVGGAWPNPI
ncbi:hypothetical protein F5B20DRAFT_591176 [Whalleya microplaca]|nr:hypothetical protein F5B20DRAFT_591176 [Whalleya microplaca]